MAGRQYTEHFIANEFNIEFFTKYQTYDYIKNDSDGFIAKIPLSLIHERGFNSNDDYRESACKSAVGFNDYEKRRLTIFALAVDDVIREYYHVEPSSVTWKFAMTEAKNYEMGEGHVRADIIFLSTDISSQLSGDVMNDSCQLGAALLYYRQNILFGKQILQSLLPWSPTNTVSEFFNKSPSCDFWRRLDKYDEYYDKMFTGEKTKFLASTKNDSSYLMNEDSYKARFTK